MDFDVYCDESRPDLFATKRIDIGSYMLIGSVWFPTINLNKFRTEIMELRKSFHTYGEMKWRTISPSRLDFYFSVIDWFFAQGLNCEFRCIAVRASEVDLETFHESDQELGFYKFYYQLLYHWLQDSHSYRIYTDFKPNRARDRLKVLEECLRNSKPLSDIKRVQALNSKDSQFIQLADLLTGAVGACAHGVPRSDARKKVIERIALHLGHDIRPTLQSERKFNVFQIDLVRKW